MRLGMFALISPVTTSTLGRWVATTRWMPTARGHLRDAADRVLDSSGRHHHQVGQLVDHDDDVAHVPVLVLPSDRQAQRALAQALLVAVDVAHADRREHLVAHLHLAHDPLERLGGPLRVHDHRLSRCGTSAKWLSSTPLGVDEHQPHVVGARAHQDRRDEAVDEARLAGAGRPGDQHVRHRREVHHLGLAVDVLAEGDLRAGAWPAWRPWSAGCRRASRSRGGGSAPRCRSRTCRGSGR